MNFVKQQSCSSQNFVGLKLDSRLSHKLAYTEKNGAAAIFVFSGLTMTHGKNLVHTSLDLESRKIHSK